MVNRRVFSILSGGIICKRLEIITCNISYHFRFTSMSIIIFVPKSWRWLISVGKCDEAKIVTINIGKRQNNMSDKDVEKVENCINLLSELAAL